MRYSSKATLEADIHAEHDRLVAMLDETPVRRFAEPGVWGDNWTLNDLVAHLAEWQTFFLGWYDAGRAGLDVELPAPGYKWNETPRLNRDIREKYCRRSARANRADFDRGYARICNVVRAASEEELFTRGYASWTGGNALVTYLGANTASHYRFARKVIERWRRRTVVKPSPSMMSD